jgi:DNA-directed RNA polymerase subunit M/transcription elongation factor TFIIS
MSSLPFHFNWVDSKNTSSKGQEEAQMEDSLWAAIKTDWHDRARCAGVNQYQFFPTIETDSGLDKVRSQFCDHCPVLGKCLNSALINGDLGYWGGTSTDMRKALRRTRARSKCPLCKGKSLLTVEVETTGDDEASASSYQVCIACGASWRAVATLTLITEVPSAEAVST